MKPVTATDKPEDYEHDYKRGTVDFDSKWRNYCYHIVIIPDGTVVKACNFSQIEPKVDCIKGNNLTFEDCNLVNVEINPAWKLINCNTSQHWTVEEDIVKEIPNDFGGTTQVVRKKEVVKVVGKHSKDFNKEDLIKPQKAITEKPF